MANLPTDPGTGLEPKMVLLPQLKRYDQKIKEKINNSSSSYITGVEDSEDISLFVENSILYAEINNTENIVASGMQDLRIDKYGIVSLSQSQAPIGLAINPKGGISATSEALGEIGTWPALELKLNVGKGVKLDPDTGALEANVDGITIGINGNTGMMSVRPTESITVTNQPSSGSVTAQYNPGSVCIHFNDAFVSGSTKTKVGQLATTYAPSVKVTGSVAGIGGSGYLLTAFCQVDTDGSIYINPVKSSGTDIAWTGMLTYLI